MLCSNEIYIFLRIIHHGHLSVSAETALHAFSRAPNLESDSS